MVTSSQIDLLDWEFLPDIKSLILLDQLKGNDLGCVIIFLCRLENDPILREYFSRTLKDDDVIHIFFDLRFAYPDNIFKSCIIALSMNP